MEMNFFFLILLYLLRNIATETKFLDQIIPAYKVSTSDYSFMIQLFRFNPGQNEWINVGQAAVIQSTKAFTAAAPLYNDSEFVISYSNIACKPPLNGEQFLRKFEDGDKPDPYYATRLIVAGGKKGLALVAFEQIIHFRGKPVPLRKDVVQEFEPCISVSWTQHDTVSVNDLHAMVYTITPKQMCSGRYKRKNFHICGRSDSKPPSYLGDGDMGAALICGGRLAGVGLPMKLPNGQYAKEIATFVSINYFLYFFTIKDSGYLTKWRVDLEIFYILFLLLK